MDRSASNAVYWYIQELASKVVAETGIPTDRHHLGKLILRSLKDAPDHILQIDGATDERETFQSVHERSIRCAIALRNLGLKFEDVIVIMGPNHNDLVIPMYASLYVGTMVIGVDMDLPIGDLQDNFKCCVPKIVFCQNENVKTVQDTLNLLNLASQIIVFGENENYLTFSKLLNEYGGDTTEDFKPADFDADVTNALLISTSGSTGIPKIVVLTHKNLILGCPPIMITHTKYPTPVNMGLVISPIQWISSIFQFLLSPILRYTRLQTSLAPTIEHIAFLINKYRPDFSIINPTILTILYKTYWGKCDLSCFEFLFVGGSVVPINLVPDMKEKYPNVYVYTAYGATETAGLIFNSVHAPAGSIGSPLGILQYKLVDPDTNEEILRPNVSGELRLKGPTMFKCYYNFPEVTAASFDEDGWFKTGDMLYRDEYHNYYFFDRYKFLLKYKNHQISPVEIESVIIKHPAVLNAIITSITNIESDDLVVAMVIRRDGYDITAKEIKDVVKASLADENQLRGGVIFLKEFPTTSTSKVDRRKLRELAQVLNKE